MREPQPGSALAPAEVPAALRQRVSPEVAEAAGEAGLHGSLGLQSWGHQNSEHIMMRNTDKPVAGTALLRA